MNKRFATFGFVIVWLLTAVSVSIIYFNQSASNNNEQFINDNNTQNYFYEKKVFTRHTKTDFENVEIEMNNIKVSTLKESTLKILNKSDTLIKKPILESTDGFDIKSIPVN